jgi:hypothetical protein
MQLPLRKTACRSRKTLILNAKMVRIPRIQPLMTEYFGCTKISSCIEETGNSLIIQHLTCVLKYWKLLLFSLSFEGLYFLRWEVF